MSSTLEKLLESARREMTPEERELQRRSFVYGNLKIEDDSVTRELVNEVAEEMSEPEEKYSEAWLQWAEKNDPCFCRMCGGSHESPGSCNTPI